MSFTSSVIKKKKLTIAVFIIAALLLSLCSGCGVIPLNKEIVSEEVIGQRFDGQDEIIEEVLKRKVRQNIYVVFGPDGSFVKDYWILTEFHFKKDNVTKKLSHLDFFWDRSMYEIHNLIRPIEGSPKWICNASDGIGHFLNFS